MIKTISRNDIEAFVSFVFHDMIPDYGVSVYSNSFCVECYFSDLKIGDRDFQSEYNEFSPRYRETINVLKDTEYFSYEYTRNNVKGETFALVLVYSKDIQVN